MHERYTKLKAQAHCQTKKTRSFYGRQGLLESLSRLVSLSLFVKTKHELANLHLRMSKSLAKNH